MQKYSKFNQIITILLEKQIKDVKKQVSLFCTKKIVNYNHNLYVVYPKNNKGKLQIFVYSINFDTVTKDLTEKDFFQHKIKLVINNQQLIQQYNPDNIIQLNANPNDLKICYLTINKNKKGTNVYLLTLENLQKNKDKNYQQQAFLLGQIQMDIYALQWYPFSPHTICILNKSQKFLAFDYEQSIQVPFFELDLNQFVKSTQRFIDFKFRGLSKNVEDLSVFSLFFLTNYGQIGCIQPFILNNMQIPLFLYERIKKRLFDGDYGQQYYLIFKLISNKLKQVYYQIRNDKVIFRTLGRLKYNFMKFNVQNERVQGNYKFNIIEDFKFLVVILSKLYNNGAYDTLECLLYPAQIDILPFFIQKQQKQPKNIFKISQFHLQTNIQPLNYPNFYPKLLNTKLIHNSIFIVSFNNIFSIDFSFIRVLQQKFTALQYLNQQTFQFKKIIQLEANHHFFYGIFIDQQFLTILSTSQQKGNLNFKIYLTHSILNLNLYNQIQKQINQNIIKKIKQFKFTKRQRKQLNIKKQLENQFKSNIQICKGMQNFKVESINRLKKAIYELDEGYKQLSKLLSQRKRGFNLQELVKRTQKIRAKNETISRIINNKSLEKKKESDDQDQAQMNELYEKKEQFRKKQEQLRMEKLGKKRVGKQFTQDHEQQIDQILIKTQQLKYKILQIN